MAPFVDMKCNPREELNTENLREAAGLLIAIDIEEQIYAKLRGEGLGGYEARRIVINGGLKVGNSAPNRRDHLEARIFQHALGQIIDWRTNHDPDSKNYHKEQYEYCLQQLQEDYLVHGPKHGIHEKGVVSTIEKMK